MGLLQALAVYILYKFTSTIHRVICHKDFHQSCYLIFSLISRFLLVVEFLTMIYVLVILVFTVYYVVQHCVIPLSQGYKMVSGPSQTSPCKVLRQDQVYTFFSHFSFCMLKHQTTTISDYCATFTFDLTSQKLSLTQTRPHLLSTDHSLVTS